MAEPEVKSSIQVIGRMMRLVDVLVEHPEPMSLKQLAGTTGLHPSTAHRILAVLVEHRLVERNEAGAYRLGIRFLQLGHLVKSRIDVREIALPFMQRLHEELQQTVNLSVRQGDEIIYVERIYSNRSMMRVEQFIGARAPLHITAVGKIYLSEADGDESRRYAARTGLPAFTENTLQDWDSLFRETERIRRQGYAFDREEAEKGVSCIGAGIYDDEGKLVAGLSVSAPSDRLDRAWAPKVKATADAVSRALGYRARM